MNIWFLLLIISLFAIYLNYNSEPFDIVPCDNQCQKRRYEVCLIKKTC